VFLKSARDIYNDLDFIIRNGIEILESDMKKAPRFDPDNKPEYDKKNEYFNNANYVCQVSLWKLGLYDLSERYYEAMLRDIRQYEITNKTNFNKGMVYANLGVAQAAQGKIDEGFASILKAHMEDEPYHTTDSSKTVFNLELYQQFEDCKAGFKGVKDYILEHSQLYQREDSKIIDKAYLSGLTASLDADIHLLFVSVVEKIRRNFIALTDKDNRFTRLQLFLCLQDLCLSIENAIKTKNHLSGTLKPLLDVLFSTSSGRQRLPWKPIFDNNYQLTSANTTQLENNLKSIIAITDNVARRLLIFCLVRNFSSHNLDVGNNYVFSNIEMIFDNILSSILFLHEKGCI